MRITIDFLTHPLILFITTFIWVLTCIILSKAVKGWIYTTIFFLLSIPGWPPISFFTIQYLSEYGRNIPDVNTVIYKKEPITNLIFKQDDDAEFHYSFQDRQGMHIGKDAKIDFIYVNTPSYADYEYTTKTNRDWATLDQVENTYKILRLCINKNYKIEIFND